MVDHTHVKGLYRPADAVFVLFGSHGELPSTFRTVQVSAGKWCVTRRFSLASSVTATIGPSVPLRIQVRLHGPCKITSVRPVESDLPETLYVPLGEKARRRDPRSAKYAGIACPEMKKVGAHNELAAAHRPCLCPVSNDSPCQVCLPCVQPRYHAVWTAGCLLQARQFLPLCTYSIRILASPQQVSPQSRQDTLLQVSQK